MRASFHCGTLSSRTLRRTARELMVLGGLLVACGVAAGAQTAAPPAATPAAAARRGNLPTQVVSTNAPSTGDPRLDAIVDQAAQHELNLVKVLATVHPRVETYLQEMRPDPVLGEVPNTDRYFLGRMDFNRRVDETSFLSRPTLFASLFHPVKEAVETEYAGSGFASMMLPDPGHLDRRHYHFTYLHQEFLGNVRTNVFNVEPLKGAGRGAFLGRVWIEDRGNNIVRVNGTFINAPWFSQYFHFDGWRVNTPTGLWVPAFIYSEERDVPSTHMLVVPTSVHFKAETRVWGYALKSSGNLGESTETIIHEADNPQDQPEDYSPLESQRLFERDAENNYLDRLQRAGLLAPPSSLDKILETVVNNVAVTNHLNIDPAIRCRVLLTSPLEVEAVGHSILISRGLIDVLPDEASLAMVLTHALARIALGYQMDTQFAFADRTMFQDPQTLERLKLRDDKKMKQVDQKTLVLLKNSPYAGSLPKAGLFLRALQAEAGHMPQLMRARLGDPMGWDGRVRMDQVMAQAPKLNWAKLDQIEALPLGARVHVDPWSDQVTMMHDATLELLSPKEKMPFQVAPLRPYLAYASTGDSGTATATAAPASTAPASANTADASPAAAAPATARTAASQPGAPARPANPQD